MGQSRRFTLDGRRSTTEHSSSVLELWQHNPNKQFHPDGRLEAPAVDAAEEQGDQPPRTPSAKGWSRWRTRRASGSRQASKSCGRADGLRQKGLEAEAVRRVKDRAKLFDLNALQANDPLFAAGEQPAAPAAEPDAAPTTNDDAHARDSSPATGADLGDARRVEGEQLRENRLLAAPRGAPARDGGGDRASRSSDRAVAEWESVGARRGDARSAPRGGRGATRRRSATPPRRCLSRAGRFRAD